VATTDDKVCKHFGMLELKQSFVQAIDQQAVWRNNMSVV